MLSYPHFRRVYDIVSLLPLEELDVLRRDWAKGGVLGVTKEQFLTNMLRVSKTNMKRQGRERESIPTTRCRVEYIWYDRRFYMCSGESHIVR